MMADRYKINLQTGELEKIPEAEQAELLAAQEPEAPSPQDAADAAFMARHIDDAPEEAPESEAGAPAEPEESGVGATITGAAIGARFGFAGAAAGAAAGFLISKLKSDPSPIGTLLGNTEAQETGGEDLAKLLEVTLRIARAGIPVKNEVRTKAVGSRM